MQSGFIKLDQRLPQVDNNVNSFWYNGDDGPGVQGRRSGLHRRSARSASRCTAMRSFTPGRDLPGHDDAGRPALHRQRQRELASVHLAAERGDVGLDLTDRSDYVSSAASTSAPTSARNRLGFATDARDEHAQLHGEPEQHGVVDSRSVVEPQDDRSARTT